jgi:hypothetical protein
VLGAVGGEGGALDVAAVSHGDDHVLATIRSSSSSSKSPSTMAGAGGARRTWARLESSSR